MVLHFRPFLDYIVISGNQVTWAHLSSDTLIGCWNAGVVTRLIVNHPKLHSECLNSVSFIDTVYARAFHGLHDAGITTQHSAWLHCASQIMLVHHWVSQHLATPCTVYDNLEVHVHITIQVWILFSIPCSSHVGSFLSGYLWNSLYAAKINSEHL